MKCRTGAKDLAASAAYPAQFGAKVAELHDELVPRIGYMIRLRGVSWDELSKRSSWVSVYRDATMVCPGGFGTGHGFRALGLCLVGCNATSGLVGFVCR